MRILVVNAGSSSLKSQLIETDGKVSLMKCLAEKVGTPDAYMNVSFAPDFQKATYRVADMTVAECLKKLLEVLVDDPESPISDLSQIDAIGNRIVAGGEYFTKSVIIDEPAREKLELCEELEKELGLDTYAMNWPIGCGKEFKGVYDRQNRKVIHFTSNTNARAATATEIEPDDPALAGLIGQAKRDQLVDEIELLDGASCDFDLDRVRHGKLSPVFFGSALTNFGVEPFLEEFLRMTTAPLPRMAGDDVIDSFDEDFSAFVFKIQANMNKAHRDRIAFMRIVSGKFEADREVYHVQGGKKIRLSRPQQLMAAEREIIEEAYAGDIIGVFDPGIFSIGDTLCAPSRKFRFDPIPTFAPEHFERIRSVDTMKRKQFLKGVEQIAQEGAIQIFKVPDTGMEEVIVGVVGTLQFDVFRYRMHSEYGVELRMEGLPYEVLRYIRKSPVEEKELNLSSDVELLEDYRGHKLLVFSSPWAIDFTLRRNPGLELVETLQELDTATL